MGLIRVDLFTTLDGVAQAPGGPQEDTERGFRFGGWQAPMMDEMVGEWVGNGMQGMDALLLGRKTYDIFAGYWPNVSGGEDGSIADLFNRIPKYVASRNRNLDLLWGNSTLLGPDLAADIRALRERHEIVHVIGSVDLFQTLLAERLFDELTLWVYPIVLGQGKRVFEANDVQAKLDLIEPAKSSSIGAVQLRYALADGTPGTGDMSQPDRGV